jgi:hypothetical protein
MHVGIDMLAIRLFTVATLVLAIVTASAEESFEAEEEAPLDTLLALEDLPAIEELTSIEGSAVDFLGGSGDFYAIGRRWCAEREASEIVELTESAQPVTRALGLWCLARIDAARAIPLLKASLLDRTLVEYQAHGCVSDRIPFGMFAWNLLHNKHCLDTALTTAPMLQPDELGALDVTVLATDACSSALQFRYAVAASLRGISFETLLALMDPSRPSADLSDLTVVKALGRAEWPDSGLLRGLLSDSTRPVASRLAAASALTRYSDLASLDCIVTQLDDGELGRGIRGLVLDQSVGSTVTTFATMLAGPGGEQRTTIELETALWATDHPQAIFELIQRLDTGLHHAEVRATVFASLIRIARRLPEFNQSWNTYSDTAIILDDLVHPKQPSELSGQPALSTEERNALAACLAAARSP